jgi:hypothetical protein
VHKGKREWGKGEKFKKITRVKKEKEKREK